MVALHGHQLVVCHSNHCALPDEHGDGSHGDRHFDGLAALVAAELIVPVVPLAACGQVDSAGLGTLFQNVGHQNIPAEQELEAFLPCLGVVLEVVDQSAHDGRTGPAGLVLGAVEIGGKAVAQQDGVPDQISGLVEHPRLGDGVVVGGRVDGEARLEDAVLHPSHEQFLGGGGTGKAADIAALVGLAGQTHAGNDGDIVLQGLPAGIVIAAPSLGVALDTGAAAAADHVGTGVGIVVGHSLCAHAAHQGAHEGLQLADGAALSVKITDALLIHQAVVLAVVVPDGIGAHGDDGLGEVLFPSCTAFGLGVVPECAVAAPPFADTVGLGVLAVADEHIVLQEFIKAGVA